MKSIDSYSKLNFIVIDVDGTMTDAGIYYDNNGNEIKKFCTRDACGFFTAHEVGMKIMVLTGRECPAVYRRMQEMKVEYICQDVKDKRDFLENFIIMNNVSREGIVYIGDDLNDYEPMKIAAFKACPADACDEIKKLSDYVASEPGGRGAVRDIICHILKTRNQWEDAIKNVYGISDLE